MVLRLFVRDIVFYHILFTYFSLTSTYFSRFLPCSGDDNNAIGFHGRTDLAPSMLYSKNWLIFYRYLTLIIKKLAFCINKQKHKTSSSEDFFGFKTLLNKAYLAMFAFK